MLLMNKCIGTIARMGGVPSLLTPFVDSFIDMAQWNAEYLCGPGEWVHYPRAPQVSIHDVARNAIAESFAGEWLLMLDTDHQFEPDIAARLIRVSEETGCDVVTGLYQYKAAPHLPVLYYHRDGGMVPIGDWDRSVSALEIDSAGAGCLFIRRGVFDRIQAELEEQPFARIKHYGEDHSFFLRLKTLGIKSVCATRVECHHLQVRPLGLADCDVEGLEMSDPMPVRGYR